MGFGDIRLIKIYDSSSGMIGIKPNGWSEVVIHTVDWRVEDVGPMTVETNFYTLAGGGCNFYVCGPDEVAPPETCTHTFKLQDQSGNPLNGNVQIGTTAVTVLGTGTITLEKGKSYTAVASFSDQPTQTKTFTACTTTTFVFNVVPDVGILNITTIPPGASISIQFVPFGVTPKLGIELDLGTHFVTLKLDGYRSVTKSVTLQAGITGIISVELTPLRDRCLRVICEDICTEEGHKVIRECDPDLGTCQSVRTELNSPDCVQTGFIKCQAYDSVTNAGLSATIRIDGTTIAPKTPHTTPALPIGSHTVSFLLVGYSPKTVTVTVKAGQTVNAYGSMVKLELPDVAGFDVKVNVPGMLPKTSLHIAQVTKVPLTDTWWDSPFGLGMRWDDISNGV